MPNTKKTLKTVIITGGGSGIGLTTARLLLEDKRYRLVLLGRNRNRLQQAADSLGGPSERVNLFTCDVRDSKQIRKTLEKIAGYKGIYGLVNNAGIYPSGGILTTSEQSWDETLAVNLKGPFLLSQAVVEIMARSPWGGRIVNVASTAGILPNQSTLAYSVSKAGLIHLTRALAKELGKDNITVNCVCPGVVRTSLHESLHQSQSELEEFYAKRGAGLPLGRVGEPQDVAGAIRYLLSEEAGWITGQALTVDGGRLLL